MADPYITFPIDTDPDVYRQQAYDFIQAQFPNWEPSEGDLATILIDIFAQIAAELGDVASAVTAAIFRYFGESILNIVAVEATQAVADSTWTMVDDTGYTIPAGTLVGIPAANGELVGFEVMIDVVVANGDTATAAGEVALQAVEPGIVGTGLSGTPQLITSLEFVQSVALVGSTSGGQDEEEEDTYQNRLSSELELLSPAPILPRDFAIIARNRIPAVYRAVAINGYDPSGGGSYNNERTVAVASIDASGAASNSTVKTEIEELLNELREVNWVTNAIDPTFTAIDVVFEIRVLNGYLETDVVDAAEAAVAAYLSPLTWGSPQIQDTSEEGSIRGPEWENDTTVRYLEIAQVINSVPGVAYIIEDSLEIEATPEADFTLTGVAPLPTPGTITGAAA